MNIAFICSNSHPISPDTTKGTEIFINLYLESLRRQDRSGIHATVFASGDSSLSFPIQSVTDVSTSADTAISKHGKTIQFELALISKALGDQDKYDLFHINIGDGDLILPFAQFVRKPIVVTLHNIYDAEHTRKYFSLFKDNTNVYFVSASNAQRSILPNVNYIQTIYHGIDVDNFAFDDAGGESVMWAGRGIPEKGLDVAMQIAKVVKKHLTAFVIQKEGYLDWLDELLLQAKSPDYVDLVSIYLNQPRQSLIQWYQKSKVYLHTFNQEEAFGLVLAEAMACGTPVVAYARGAIPEVVKDGITGYIVNSSDEEICGNWIVKKTGAQGLIEAIERIYGLPEKEYIKMRYECTRHARNAFSADRMAREYAELYSRLLDATAG